MVRINEPEVIRKEMKEEDDLKKNDERERMIKIEERDEGKTGRAGSCLNTKSLIDCLQTNTSSSDTEPERRPSVINNRGHNLLQRGKSGPLS